ncbi:uncharacterized protein LOC122012658 [Zingiber officinale]|uniref:Uncharacterized protein n=1 Tax=Zingiber officinale TaxID=94328 RepID=A0A8J5FCV0_ZINOF|nr:uncharacterized protein LOC122012658 [Zingiber officinale]KAG6484515.1 hypothetical protein ZIOFF_053033 [Zingiber officinale]
MAGMRNRTKTPTPHKSEPIIISTSNRHGPGIRTINDRSEDPLTYSSHSAVSPCYGAHRFYFLVFVSYQFIGCEGLGTVAETASFPLDLLSVVPAHVCSRFQAMLGTGPPDGMPSVKTQMLVRVIYSCKSPGKGRSEFLCYYWNFLDRIGALLMLEQFCFFYQMAILCSASNTSVAVALCLLLLILWGFCNDHPISAFLTLFVLVLSPSALFAIKQLGKAQRPSQSFADKKAATGSGVASLESEGSEYQLTSKAPCTGTELSEKDEENSISDDENLIEISLPDGHFLAHDGTKALLNLKPLPSLSGFLPSPLQDAVVRQQGVMELLPEINEEENLIEIDIVRGSIKCSRIGIKT